MMRPVPSCLSCLLVVLGSAIADIAIAADAAVQHEAVYRVREISAPDDANCVPGFQRITFARRLNEKTQAAGYDFCYVATGDPAAPYVLQGARAFRWSRAAGTSALPSLTEDPSETYGRDINNFGTVVGWEFDQLGNARAPKWPLAGGVSDAIELPACFPDLVITRADGINDRGSIATSGFRVGADGVCRLGWVLKRASGEEIISPVTGGSLFSINIHDAMVGSSQNNAVKWSPAIGQVVLSLGSSAPPFVVARAWSINDRNQAVGVIERFNDDFSCLLGSDAKFWAADGAVRALPGLPGAPFITAFGINQQGVIVGFSQYGAPCDAYDPSQLRATVWHNRRPEDLNDLIPRRIARDIQLILAASINDQGEILARGIRRDTQEPCPTFVFDPDTGESTYDPTPMCYSERAFLLTPQ